MRQPTLFDLDAPPPSPRRGRIDAESEVFLERYAVRYRLDRSAGAVRGEVSQLRTVAREAAQRRAGRTLHEVLSDTSTLAAVLTAPGRQPSATTALIRLGAINAALLLLFGPNEGRRRIGVLDDALPQRDGTDWYQSGVLLAGQRSRRRAQSPTIEPSDLARIVEAAGIGKCGRRSLWDRVLVAVHCYSGLDTGEIRGLRWGDLRWEAQGDAWSAPVERGAKRTRLAIFGSAASLMIRLRLEAEQSEEFVFSNSRVEALTERQMRRIVLGAYSAAGFPRAERNTLFSAAAAYLGAAGFRDHEVAITLGIADMRTINRLLRPHQRLQFQRKARRPGG